MQVTLTGRAEKLLRQALASNPGRSPEEILEQALSERNAPELVPSQADPLWDRLKRIPGAHLPHHWPPQFAEFEPLHMEGEPVSEQLIRERR